MIGYLFTLLAILGTITNSLGKKICFIFWGFSNTYFITMNMFNADYPQALVFILNLVMAVVGYYLWSKKDKEAKRE